MVAGGLCPGKKKSLFLPPGGKNCLLLIREKTNSLVFLLEVKKKFGQKEKPYPPPSY